MDIGPIDWQSESTEILFNPRLPEHETKVFESLPKKDDFHNHIWVATSGTSGRTKFAALSKQGILISAQSVNLHIDAHSADVWLHVLPDFHVGGLGIWARAYLSDACVFDFKATQLKWNPHNFWIAAQQTKATLTALVPTQVYDLVSHKLEAPPSLRAVIVGGGGMSHSLYSEARHLGWKLMPSYGLTECASQVATARLDGPFGRGEILPHVEVKIDSDGCIVLKSQSLLTAYGMMEGERLTLVDPKRDGWFKTEDKGDLTNSLAVHGRSSDFVKIGGESCSMVHLRAMWEDAKRGVNVDAVIAAYPDERLGHAIHLFVANDSNASKMIDTCIKRFNERVLPFERIRHMHHVDKIPRSPLGKVIYHQIHPPAP